ncbi:MAG: hypothetical protein ACK5KU_07860, partial [Beutenbergiaceae bacterium]
QLLGAARDHRVPTIVSTCVRGNMLGQSEFTALHPDTLFVPMADDDQAWLARVPDFDIYFVEKGSRPPGAAFDAANNPAELFRYNPNINRLLYAVDIPEWIVFGNAMDTCANRVVMNFLAQGRTVHYVPELMIPSTKCGDCDPEVFKQHVYDRWHKEGVRPLPLAAAIDHLRAAARVEEGTLG